MISQRLPILGRTTHLLCPISSSRGLPSPALLLGTRPVWYCGGNSWGGCSAFGRSCRKRSMVNCASASSKDEFADDLAAGSCMPCSSPFLAARADGRRAMIRDSILKIVVQGIALEQDEQKKELRYASAGDAVRTVRRSFSPSPDPIHGAVKRSTLCQVLGPCCNDV